MTAVERRMERFGQGRDGEDGVVIREETLRVDQAVWGEVKRISIAV